MQLADNKQSRIAQYEEQLPKRQKIDLIFSITFLASILTIVVSIASALGYAFDATTYASLIYSIAILAMLILCIIYIVYREVTAKHRFSEYVYYSHYVNHVTRDYMNISSGDSDLESFMSNVCDKIAECFSVTTAKKCFCVIKAIKNDEYGNLLVYEKYSDRAADTDKNPTKLDDWTSLSSIFHNHNPRYYLCDDVAGAHKLHKYKSPKLRDYEYNASRWFRSGWPLKFRSTLVLPIRYGAGVDQDTSPDYFGFLCIDCGSRKAFDHRYHPEMAAAFADLIYMILSVDAGAPDTPSADEAPVPKEDRATLQTNQSDVVSFEKKSA